MITLVHDQHQSGFTIIELLVVISLTVMLMLAATGLFFATLLSSSKTQTGQRVKNEGEYALSQIEFLLRNAIEIQDCQANSITFLSYDSGITTLTQEDDPSDATTHQKIASNSALYLTSSVVTIPDELPLTFLCQTAPDSSTYITVSFGLRAGEPGVDAPRDIETETFTTSVAVRSIN